MNVVFIKHVGCNKPYMFEVPNSISLKEGDDVVVQVASGETTGTCISDSFELDGSPLAVVAKRFGASIPLRPVVGKVCVVRFNG